MTCHISNEIRGLANQFQSDHEFIQHLRNNDSAVFTIHAFYAWLEKKQDADQHSALTEYLLIQALLSSIAKKREIAFASWHLQKTSFTTKLKWCLLLFTGTAFVASDAAGTILGLIGSTSIPTSILVGGAMIYAVIAIAMFYAFELYAISQELGVSFRGARHIVDRYLNELENLNGLIEGLEQKTSNDDHKKTEDNTMLAKLLCLRLNALKQTREKLEQAAGAKKITRVKNALMVFGALIYGATGFFSGNAAASSIAAIFMTTVPFLFWPTLLAGAVISLCAVYVYLYVQKPAVESFVEKTLGVDPEKLQALENKISDLDVRVNRIQRELSGKTELELKNQELQEENNNLNQQLHDLKKKLNPHVDSGVKVSQHSFLNSNTVLQPDRLEENIIHIENHY